MPFSGDPAAGPAVLSSVVVSDGWHPPHQRRAGPNRRPGCEPAARRGTGRVRRRYGAKGGPEATGLGANGPDGKRVDPLWSTEVFSWLRVPARRVFVFGAAPGGVEATSRLVVQG
ncbi:hypothetical protein [Azospirillum melinis]